MAMRLVVLIALCVLPALVCARPAKTDFIVQGRVYCDTCQAGFETSATTYIHGARVMVKCRDIKSDKTTYSCEGVTDGTGTYKIPISGDHENEVCETVLVSSPQQDCATVAPGRDRARLALAHNNGIVSDNRYANNMGFMKDAPLAGCTDLLKQYQEFDD
ncbi:pollen-specific protein [Cinnamomum micranthum f. kanehirae]|uniref:Pollen-specific protein n=1 Tax=Cinnamomum micranthum f. kanehirae TaxID=337451 RepID=A0A443PQH1_9MAGN|nr:pollen-specific protein [Cinnamomum micranthum f. kanehirae]